MILIVAGRTYVLRIGVDMLYSMFDFENHNPDDVSLMVANLYNHPDMYEWYNHTSDQGKSKLSVGDCMSWIQDVFHHATDNDRLRSVANLEHRIMPYWIRDLYDAAMGYFDALDICGDCPNAVGDDDYVDNCVTPTAADCYQRRAKATYKHMSQAERDAWDKLQFDVVALIDDYLRDVMPDDSYSYDAAKGYSAMYDKYLDDVHRGSPDFCEVYADDPERWYQDWWMYNPYIDPVVPLAHNR